MVLVLIVSEDGSQLKASFINSEPIGKRRTPCWLLKNLNFVGLISHLTNDTEEMNILLNESVYAWVTHNDVRCGLWRALASYLDIV